MCIFVGTNIKTASHEKDTPPPCHPRLQDSGVLLSGLGNGEITRSQSLAAELPKIHIRSADLAELTLPSWHTNATKRYFPERLPGEKLRSTLDPFEISPRESPRRFS